MVLRKKETARYVRTPNKQYFWTLRYIDIFSNSQKNNIFFYFTRKHSCRYSVEFRPWPDSSNEYPHICFHEEIRKKKIDTRLI